MRRGPEECPEVSEVSFWTVQPLQFAIASPRFSLIPFACVRSPFFSKDWKDSTNREIERNQGEGLGGGVTPIIYVSVFPIILSAFGTGNRPNINKFGGHRPA